MRTRITAFLLLIVILFSLPVGGLAQDEYGPKIEQYVAEHMDTTAGLSVGVFNSDGALYEGYFGHADLENQLSMTADTVVEWGSVTKLLVWVSTMQQVERGNLDLNADIRTYLPEGFLRSLRYEKPITLINLMNHNAGFEETLIGMMTMRKNEVLDLETYLRTYQPRQVYQPGTIAAYSNWGVALAGYIVERVSGQSFAQYVHENIFAPLDMKDSALLPDLSDNPSVQQRRSALKCYTTKCKLIPNAFQYIVMYPAGMCTSTLRDFMRFGTALLSRDSSLMKAETWAELFTPTNTFKDEANTPVNYHGFWNELRAVTLIGHGGNTNGCSSKLLINPESNLGMVVMTNQSGESIYNAELYDHIFGPYQGEVINYRGWARSARTIHTGPLKIYKIMSIMPVNDSIIESYLSSSKCELVEENGFQRAVMAYGDNRAVSFFSLVPEILLLLFWVLSVVLWIAGLVMLMFGKTRLNVPKNLKRWRITTSLVGLYAPIGVAVIAISLLTFSWLPMWCYPAISAMSIVVLAWQVYLFIRGAFVANHITTKKARKWHVLTMLTIVVSVINILYWQMYAFWMF